MSPKSILSRLFPKNSTSGSATKRGKIIPLIQTINNIFKGPSADSRETLESFSSIVFACVDAITSAVKDVEFREYEGYETRKEIFDSPELDLIYRPNDEDLGTGFRQVQTMFDLMLGETVTLITPGRDGRPERLDWLFPQNTQIEIKNGKKVYRYYSMDGGKMWEIPEEYIIFTKKPHPFDRYRGYGKGQAALLAIHSILTSQEFRKRYLENGAVLSGYLYTEQQLDETEIASISKQFRDESAGFANAGNVPLFHSGVEWKPVSSNIKDMDMPEADKISREDIMYVFRVSEWALGSLNGTLASAEMAERQFRALAVLPEANFWAEWYTERLLPLFGVKNRYIEAVNVVPDDMKALSEIQDKNKAILTVNERRAIIKHAPLKGGDIVDPDGETLSGAADRKSQPGKTSKNSLSFAHGFTSEEFTEYYVNQTEPLEKQLENAIKADFVRQGDEIAAKLLLLGKYDSSLAYFDVKLETSKLQNTLLNHYSAAAQQGADIFTQVLDSQRKQENSLGKVKNSLSIAANPALYGKLIALAREYAEKITLYTNELLLETLQEGLDATDSIQDLATRIQELFRAMGDAARTKRSRAELIGRDGINMAQNFGNHEAFLAEDSVEDWEWISIHDKNTRHAHREADGQVVKKGEPFIVMNEKLRYPHDPAGKAENIIGCRCTAVPRWKE